MKKLPLWKNIMLIISIWVVIIVATLAWFTTGPRAEVDEMALNVSQSSYIKISAENGDWSGDLDMDVGVNANLKEISGDGTRFFTPVYDVVEKADGGYTSTIIGFEEVEDTSLYFEQTLVFQADADFDLFLAPGSTVTAIPNAADGRIDGAVRIAFFELDNNGNETLKCIWAPNSKVEYVPGTDTFLDNGNVETDYYYQKTLTVVDHDDLQNPAENLNIGWISTADPENPGAVLECGYDETNKFMWSCGDVLPDNAPSMLTITRNPDEMLTTKKMKVRVWLEGYDRECVSRLSGQKFTMSFHFNAEMRNNDD